MHCVVQKPFNGNGVEYQSNWLVDTGNWPIRRRDQLISQRFIGSPPRKRFLQLLNPKNLPLHGGPLLELGRESQPPRSGGNVHGSTREK